MRNPTIVTFILALLLGAASAAQHVHPAPSPTTASTSTTALSAEAVQQLLAGEGMGLARPAELNDHPGPKHVLELKGALALTPSQEQQVEAIRQRMLASARDIGRQIVDAERALDAAFDAGAASEADVAERVGAIAKLQGELRAAHLLAHVRTKALLTPGQVRRYYERR